MSFDKTGLKTTGGSLSQSLWNRAMSFDSTQARIRLMIKVSIPLEQGNVFRLQRIGSVLSNVASQSLWNRAMSFD